MSQAQALDSLKQGIGFARAGDKEKARPLMRRAVELDPFSEPAWMWLASLAESPGEALAALERVLAINPSHEKARAAVQVARLQAGIAAARTHHKAEARALLHAVVAAEPGNELAWMWLANIAESPTDAVSCLEKALAVNPANERARAGIEHFRAARPPRLSAPVPPKPILAPTDPPAWRCPLCHAEADKEPDRCPACRAILRLDDMEAFFHQEGVDADRVHDAVRRMKEQPGTPNFPSRRLLAIGFLNLKQFDAAAAELQAALRLRPSDRELLGRLETLVRCKAAAAAVQGGDNRPRKTVLTVDDSPTIRKLVTMTLERRGYQVWTAADASGAIDVLRDQGAPGLILLDIAMPGMDGYELCKLLRQDRETSRIPIVMLSGKDGLFNKVRGRMAGATSYIAKPFEPEGLLHVIEQYCRPEGVGAK